MTFVLMLLLTLAVGWFLADWTWRNDDDDPDEILSEPPYDWEQGR